ncbi:MAG: rRNA maturation RNase YbeY [Bacteroidetes bacterium]|nr:rRNA maturation RNase YbeY [Bacteroidota bacterium]
MIKNLYVSSSNKKINKTRIHKLVGLLREDLEFSIESLFITFITANDIHNVNKEFLNHNCSTDIITFNYSGSHFELDGEIFISIDDAKISARKYKVSLSKEFTRLIIHGILHLKGYDDIKKNDRVKMKRIENNLTNIYNFALLS